ncbi:MAG: flippase-like domain-containing protein [Bacteroidales bacterium]|nr:flippase-like domain-containing protein [Bacteroidales bacterium]
MNKTVGNILKYSLSFALAAVLVWLVARQIDWKSFAEGLRTTRWEWMLGFFAASVLALVFRAQRWKLLLKPLDPEMRLGRCWDANNIGNLGSLVIPGSCEPIRAGIITSKKLPFQTVLGTMIMERAWDFLFILLTFVVALIARWNTFGGFISENIFGPVLGGGTLWWILGGAVALGVLLLWACRHFRSKHPFLEKIAVLIDGLLQGLGSFGRMKKKLPYLFHTTMIWVMYMFMCWFCLKAVPELGGRDLADALFISALGNVSSVIPVPGGMGAYHYIIMHCISSLYGQTGETGLLYAMLNHEGHAVVILVLGIISYTARMLVLRKK